MFNLIGSKGYIWQVSIDHCHLCGQSKKPEEIVNTFHDWFTDTAWGECSQCAKEFGKTEISAIRARVQIA